MPVRLRQLPPTLATEPPTLTALSSFLTLLHSPSPSPFPSCSHIRIGLVSAAHRDKTMMCPFTYLRVPKVQVVAAHLGVTPVMHAR